MKEVVEKYNYSGSIQGNPQFMLELGISFHDIAYGNGFWWFAVNDGTYSIKAYNSSGTLQLSVPVANVPAAYGLTFDDDGYLWVSDLDTDQIYKVDVNVSALNRTTWAGIKTTF